MPDSSHAARAHAGCSHKKVPQSEGRLKLSLTPQLFEQDFPCTPTSGTGWRSGYVRSNLTGFRDIKTQANAIFQHASHSNDQENAYSTSMLCVMQIWDHMVVQWLVSHQEGCWFIARSVQEYCISTGYFSSISPHRPKTCMFRPSGDSNSECESEFSAEYKQYF